MKKKTTRLALLCALLFTFTSALAQDTISVDATALAAGNTGVKANLSQSFVLEFKKNTVSTSAQIIVFSESGIPQKIKNGFKSGDRKSISVPFIFDATAGKLTTKNVEGLSFQLSSPIQIVYNDIELLISSTDAGPGIPAAPAGPGTPTANERPQTGVAIHDAILAKTLFTTDKTGLYSLLRSYRPGANTVDLPTIQQEWKDNPFITALLQDNRLKAAPSVTGVQGGGFSKLVKKVGNTDVTTVVDGIARFLVRRAKEELSVAFFQRFRDLINKPAYLDAALLFPETLKTLNAIDEEIYQFENYIAALRESFEQDLGLLLDHLPDVIEEGNFSGYFAGRPTVKYSSLLSIFVARELINGTHPGKVLEMLPADYIENLSGANKDISASLQTMQLLSASLQSRGTERYWTSLDSIQLLYRNDEDYVTARFYLGFVYEKAGAIAFKSGTLQTFLASIASSMPDIKKCIVYIKEVGKKYHNVEAAIRQIREKNDETPSIDVYNRLFNAFADGVEQLSRIDELPIKGISPKLTADIRYYVGIFRQTNELALNVVRKKYGLAAVNVFNIYLAIVDKKKDVRDEIIAKNDKLSLSNTLVDGKGTDVVKANETALKTSEFIRKYGTFMANVIKANSSDEVADAIESVALPVGSASIKRHSNWTISLNAYVGLYLGAEKIKGVDEKFEPNSFGVTAPIGINISKGINWRKRGGWSTSLFVSFLDLGAPVAFRFKDDKTEQLPTIQLKDIVSPGIFVSLGFPRLPISCNLGWQAGPVLRKIDPALADKASSTYSRLSVSFVVDIPVFNFFTKRND